MRIAPSPRARPRTADRWALIAFLAVVIGAVGLRPAAGQERQPAAAVNGATLVAAASEDANKNGTHRRARKSPTPVKSNGAKPAATKSAAPSPAANTSADPAPTALPLPPPPRPVFATPTTKPSAKQAPTTAAKSGSARTPTFLGAPPPPPNLAPLPEASATPPPPSQPGSSNELGLLLKAAPPTPPVLAPLAPTVEPATAPIPPTAPEKPKAAALSSRPPKSATPTPAPLPVRSGPANPVTVPPGAEVTRLLFTDGADLNTSARASLDGLVQKLRENEANRLTLAAYAAGSDDTMSKARHLSLKRALAVRAYLLERGVAQGRIDVRALGRVASDDPPDRVDLMLVRRP